MDKFTDFAELKDAVGFKETFETALAAKVSDALASHKAQVAQSMFNNNSEVNEQAQSKEVSEDVENVEEEKIEMTRGGRATGGAIKDIVAKNNARLAKKKADAMKAAKKKASEEE